MTIDYKEPVTIRSAAALTTSYVAATTLGKETGQSTKVNEYNQLILYVDFTIGSLTSAEIKVEFSPDNTSWYQESHEKLDNGTANVYTLTYTLSATGAYRIPIQCNDRYIKVSAKGTGTVTGSSMTIKAVMGVN
jgi:glucan biosynthesis protein